MGQVRINLVSVDLSSLPLAEMTGKCGAHPRVHDLVQSQWTWDSKILEASYSDRIESLAHRMIRSVNSKIPRSEFDPYRHCAMTCPLASRSFTLVRLRGRSCGYV